MGFLKIIIGTLFLFFLPFLGIDLLPDFVGYIIIFSGLSELISFSPKFRYARICALILIVITLIQYIITFPRLDFIDFRFLYRFRLGMLSTIIYILYAYFLYIGISEKAKKYRLKSLAKRTENLFIAILIANIFYLPFTFISIPFIGRIIFHITRLLPTVNFVLNIIQIFLLQEAKHYLED